MNITIISLLHDPKGIYLPLIKEVEDKLRKYTNQRLVIAVSSTTATKVIDDLENMGVIFCGGDSWGLGRINALNIAITMNEENILVIDFDKLLHWLKVDELEFDNFVNQQLDNFVILAGRNQPAWASYPESWIKTETVTNDLFTKITGIQGDILTATILMNKTAAKLILKNSTNHEWGSCGEWPMILWSNHIKIKVCLYGGLSFEDRDRLTIPDEEIKKLYDSKEEWDKRYRNQQQISQVLLTFAKN